MGCSIVIIVVVADEIVAVAHPVLLIECVSIVHSLDLDHAPLAVHLLDCAKDNLICSLTALLVKCLWACRVLPVLLQVLLLVIQLRVWLLLRVTVTVPAIEIRVPMADIVDLFRLLCHQAVVLLRGWRSCVQCWRVFIMWDGIAFLHWPRVSSSLLLMVWVAQALLL